MPVPACPVRVLPVTNEIAEVHLAALGVTFANEERRVRLSTGATPTSEPSITRLSPHMSPSSVIIGKLRSESSCSTGFFASTNVRIYLDGMTRSSTDFGGSEPITGAVLVYTPGGNNNIAGHSATALDLYAVSTSSILGSADDLPGTKCGMPFLWIKTGTLQVLRYRPGALLNLIFLLK